MSFQESTYSRNYGYDGTVDPALVSQLITTSAQVADSAITAAGNRKKGGRRRHRQKLAEIAAAEPDHSPMWPIGIGLGLLGVAAAWALSRPRPVAA